MGLVVALLISGFYFGEVLFAGWHLRKLLLNRSSSIYLLLYFLCAAILLPVNLVILVALLNSFGVDTEFVGFGFALMGAIVFCLTIMAGMLIKELWNIRQRRERG